MLADAGADGGQGVEGVARMSLRDSAFDALCDGAHLEPTWDQSSDLEGGFDALLNWLDTNAVRIAKAMWPAPYPPGSPFAVQRLVAALREGVTDEV